MEQKQIIEINGVKLEVDLRYAKRIEELHIGSRVKCLVKQYQDYAVYPGVIVGFEPFKNLPSIVVAYLKSNYNSAEIQFVSFNAETKDFEIVADLNDNTLEVDRSDLIGKFNMEIAKKQAEIDEIERRKAFFLNNFGVYFADIK